MRYDKIIFLARSAKSIDLYRTGLIKSLCAKLSVDKSGIFDFIWLPHKWRSYDLIITSDTICNLICLKIRTPQFMIVNGLGRYRRTKIFRQYLIYSINRKSHILLCVQNYLDYRYLRRYVQKEIQWVPGSGGTSRLTGSDDNPLVITRDSKIQKQMRALDDIKHLFEKINFVGLIKTKLKNENYVNIGKKKQELIFEESQTFLQLDGYGEGVPHSLVDAICSQMNIYITKASWLQFGFYKMINNRNAITKVNDKILLLSKNSSIHAQLIKKVCMRSVNTEYEQYIIKYLKERSKK